MSHQCKLVNSCHVLCGVQVLRVAHATALCWRLSPPLMRFKRYGKLSQTYQ